MPRMRKGDFGKIDEMSLMWISVKKRRIYIEFFKKVEKHLAKSSADHDEVV